MPRRTDRPLWKVHNDFGFTMTDSFALAKAESGAKARTILGSLYEELWRAFGMENLTLYMDTEETERRSILDRLKALEEAVKERSAE